MHCVTLAELAAVVSQYGTAMVTCRSKIPPNAVTCYWASSRKRFNLWNHSIARYQNAERAGKIHEMESWWTDHLSVLEEILVSEMLTRVVAALASQLESKTHRDEISPVAHAIHLSHMETSNRVHQLVLSGRGSSVQCAVKLNRLRKGVERWTDTMLGRMSIESTNNLRYCIDAERAREFAEEFRGIGYGPNRDMTCWLMNASMRDVLSRRTTAQPALPQANKDVADAVMLLFRPELFDTLGFVKQAWMHRIEADSELAECSPKAAMDDRVAFPLLNNSDEEPTNDLERWYI